MAVRPPANTPAASAAPAASEPVTAESLGWQLRAALPPLRLHSVSLYDEQANVLWLSEGALGPDEHNLVLEAMDTLSNDRGLPCYENGLEDGRVAIFLPVRAPQGDLVGVAMILADLKSVSDGVMERIVSPQVRTIMQRIAVLLRAAPKNGGAEPAPAPIPVAIAPVVELAAERAPASPRTAAAPAAAAANAPAATGAAKPGAAAKSAPNNKATASPAASAKAGAEEDASLSPQAIDDILEFELFPDVATAAAAPAERAVPTAASAATPTLAWDAADAGLELVPDNIPVAQPHEPGKAAAVAPLRSAPSAQAASAAPAASVPPSHAVPTAHAAPTLHAAAQAAPGAKPSAPVAQGSANAARPATEASAHGAAVAGASAATHVPANVPTAHAANGAASASPASVLLGSLEPPVPTLGAASAPATPVAAPAAVPATAPSTSSAGNHDSLSTTAVNVALPSGATNAPAAATKSTNATTTTKAIPSVATTGTARALNNGSATASVPALNATGTSRTLAFDPSNLILDVQPFSKLRAGGRMRRYEVLPRIPHRDSNRAPAAMDSLALQRLLSWLGSNRASWSMEPTSFSLNISISTLEDPRFPQHVASCLKANGIAPDNLGFEIAEPLCTQHRAQVERFISLCDKLGCFVVIDDFSFDSTVLPLLRSKALRLVKIDPKLTSAALRDKLSQAMVVAIVQAVKVLGIHCAAKRVESQASLQWLTAIGCDLAQGPALSQVLPIESLNMPQTPATPAAEPPKAG
jgi:EAL domain-containing protein (putative c-di-GMP-specific phosphodiesterase class I)